MSSPPVEQQLRKFLLVTSGVIFLGTPLELIFLEHYEETLQFAPFILSVVGLVTIITSLRKAQPSVLKTLRYTMGLIAFGGIFGAYEHLEHNYEFALEISPNITTGEALVEALFGASPFMAPGILCLAAVLAYAATWRHPVLSDS